jgi:hypothetical protein
MKIDAHSSSRKKKWRLRILLIGFLVAVSLEIVCIHDYGIFGGTNTDDTRRALGIDRILQMMTASILVGNLSPPKEY